MSITFPMWFIYFWAIAVALSFIKAIISLFMIKNEFERMAKHVAEIITPKIVEKVSENLTGKVSVDINNRLSKEYIIVKRPTIKIKKEEAKDA